MPIFADDRELLDRFRRGERAALAAVYERYVDEVAVLVRRGFTIEAHGHVHVTGAADVDGEHDLIQDTFVRAFEERARLSFDGLRPYRPFLLRITKNLMIDRFRARRRDGAGVAGGGGVGDLDALLEAGVDLAALPGDPAEDLHWQELAAVTAEFVARLDPRAREVVRLRFEQQLSQETAAERIGCTRRRVRSVEDQVQRQLRRHLRRLGLDR